MFYLSRKSDFSDCKFKSEPLSFLFAFDDAKMRG